MLSTLFYYYLINLLLPKYVWIENRYVYDKIAHKLSIVTPLSSLHDEDISSSPIPDHNTINEFTH